jgi:hypothetical protein
MKEMAIFNLRKPPIVIGFLIATILIFWWHVNHRERETKEIFLNTFKIWTPVLKGDSVKGRVTSISNFPSDANFRTSGSSILVTVNDSLKRAIMVDNTLDVLLEDVVAEGTLIEKTKDQDTIVIIVPGADTATYRYKLANVYFRR